MLPPTGGGGGTMERTRQREKVSSADGFNVYVGRGIRSAPTTPQHQPHSTSFLHSLNRGVGDLRSAFSTEEDFHSFLSDSDTSSSFITTHLKNDLLQAADSVTNAMSSLVRELNAQEDEEEDSLQQQGNPLLTNFPNQNMNNSWDKEETLRRLAEEEKYLEQLRNIRLSEGDSADDLDLEGQVNELLLSAQAHRQQRQGQGQAPQGRTEYLDEDGPWFGKDREGGQKIRERL